MFEQLKVEPDRVGGFPFRKADPEKRRDEFSEVQQPYSEEEAMKEAERCLLCGTPVCIDACPVLLDVRGMNEAVARGDFKTAHERIRETNPLIGVTARCCPQLSGLCEDACVLRWSGQPIGIGLIQRYVADWERKNSSKDTLPTVAKDSGKKVSVIGAGPSGLAAAELLRRYGHAVTVYDELPLAGGTARYGIPDYHLPKDVLQHEVDRIVSMGVTIKNGVRVGGNNSGDVSLDALVDESDAVLITTGSRDQIKLRCQGADLKGVMSGYDFLRDVFSNGLDNYLRNPKYELGRDIIVVGGGDSALDCARTALRLSDGGNVTVAYRRTEADMPADPIMLEEAREEGVRFLYLAEPKAFEGSGKVTTAVFDTMEMGPPDESGRSKPEAVPGKEFRLDCSSVLMAIGRGPNSFLQKNVPKLETGEKGSIAIGDHHETSIPGVFASGDVTTGETLVVKAMASGRDGAQRVHEYLMKVPEGQHLSFYEKYYLGRSYDRMMEGLSGMGAPPA